MRNARIVMASLLLATFWRCTPADAAPGPRLFPGREIEFRTDDHAGQVLARKLLRKEIAEDEENPVQTSVRTAWVGISNSRRPLLFVMSGCSPTGNCGLYAFERSERGWRRVLDSIAQRCAVMSSSHDGRQDLSASMHGSATDATIKTYWWRKGRYVRVAVRNGSYDR